MFKAPKQARKAAAARGTQLTSQRRNVASTTATPRTSKRRAVQPLSLDQSLSRKLDSGDSTQSSASNDTTTTTKSKAEKKIPASKLTNKTPFTNENTKTMKRNNNSPNDEPIDINNLPTDSLNPPERGVHPVQPKYNPFLGPTSSTALNHSFNPDLSKEQMYAKATHRFRKVNALDLTATPNSITGQQLMNKNWGIQNVLSFLKTQKVSNMVVFDTSGQSVTCDFTILCNVASTKPMQALTSKVVALGRMNKATGYDKFSAGDDPDGLWNVANLGHIVVHILTPPGRSAPMFQRVERKLLLDAKLIPVDQWDSLVDPWVRQDQELYTAQANNELLDWEEKLHTPTHKPNMDKLYGQPPPPGYYIRSNTKAISPTYNQTSEEDDYNYLDLNEQHMNKIEFMKDLGYQDEDVQLDPEIIGKALMGTVDLLPVNTDNQQGNVNTTTTGTKKTPIKNHTNDDHHAITMNDVDDDDLDEDAPAHFTNKKSGTPATPDDTETTTTTTTTRNKTKATPKSKSTKTKNTTTKSSHASFSTSLQRNQKRYNDVLTQQRQHFASEADYSDYAPRFSQTNHYHSSRNSTMYNSSSHDLENLTIGAFAHFDMDLPERSHHLASFETFQHANTQHSPLSPNNTPNLRSVYSKHHPSQHQHHHHPLSSSSPHSHPFHHSHRRREATFGSLDDPSPVLGLDLMLIGADDDRTNSHNNTTTTNLHQHHLQESDHEFIQRIESDIDASHASGMAPSKQQLLLRHQQQLQQLRDSDVDSAFELTHSPRRSYNHGSGSGTEWFDDLCDVTNDNPDYAKWTFRTDDSFDHSLEHMDHLPNSNSSKVISHHNIHLFQHNNFDDELDMDENMGDSLAEQLYPGLELEADDDADLQQFSRLLTTRHRAQHQQKLLQNEIENCVSTGWTDYDDVDDDDDDDGDDANFDDDADGENLDDDETFNDFETYKKSLQKDVDAGLGRQ